MKKLLTFLATIFISLNAFAAEYLYIQIKDKDLFALETVIRETYGSDYNYRSDYKLFTIRLGFLDKITILNSLQNANIILEATDSPYAFIASSATSREIEQTEYPLRPRNSFSGADAEIQCLLSYDSELAQPAKQYARAYGYSVQELDYQLRFMLKESQLKKFIAELENSQDFVFSNLGANKFSIKMLPLKEFKVNIYLSSSRDINDLIRDIKSDFQDRGTYELLRASEHRSAGTLSAELVVGTRSLSKDELEEILMYIARKINPSLRASKFKIKELN